MGDGSSGGGSYGGGNYGGGTGNYGGGNYGGGAQPSADDQAAQEAQAGGYGPTVGGYGTGAGVGASGPSIGGSGGADSLGGQAAADAAAALGGGAAGGGTGGGYAGAGGGKGGGGGGGGASPLAGTGNVGGLDPTGGLDPSLGALASQGGGVGTGAGLGTAIGADPSLGATFSQSGGLDPASFGGLTGAMTGIGQGTATTPGFGQVGGTLSDPTTTTQPGVSAPSGQLTSDQLQSFTQALSNLGGAPAAPTAPSTPTGDWSLGTPPTAPGPTGWVSSLGDLASNFFSTPAYAGDIITPPRDPAFRTPAPAAKDQSRVGFGDQSGGAPVVGGDTAPVAGPGHSEITASFDAGVPDYRMANFQSGRGSEVAASSELGSLGGDTRFTVPTDGGGGVETPSNTAGSEVAASAQLADTLPDARFDLSPQASEEALQPPSADLRYVPSFGDIPTEGTPYRIPPSAATPSNTAGSEVAASAQLADTLPDARFDLSPQASEEALQPPGGRVPVQGGDGQQPPGGGQPQPGIPDKEFQTFRTAPAPQDYTGDPTQFPPRAPGGGQGYDRGGGGAQGGFNPSAIVDALVRGGPAAALSQLAAQVMGPPPGGFYGRYPNYTYPQPPAVPSAPGASGPGPAAAQPPATAAGGLGGASYANQTAALESGGNPAAQTGSNRGIYQFSPDQERELGITNWQDPAQQRRALDLETRRNTPLAQQALGRPPTNADLYVMHQQGRAGGAALLNAATNNPNMPAWRAINRYYRNPQTALRAIYGNIPYGNPLRGLPASQITAGQFVGMWRNRFNRGLRQ